MTARYATPADFEWPSKDDQATTAGYDPHPDDLRAPAEHLQAGEGVDPMAVFAAEVRAIRARWTA